MGRRKIKKYIYLLTLLFIPVLSIGVPTESYKLLIHSDYKYSMDLYKIYPSGAVITKKVKFDESQFARIGDFALSNDQKRIIITRWDNSIWLYGVDDGIQKKIFQCPFGSREYYYMFFNGDRNRIWNPEDTKFSFFIGSRLKPEGDLLPRPIPTPDPTVTETLKNEGNYCFDFKMNEYRLMTQSEFETFASSQAEERNDYLKLKPSPSGKHNASFRLAGPNKDFDLLVDNVSAFHFEEPPNGYFWLHGFWLSEKAFLVLTRHWFSVIDVQTGKLVNKTDFDSN